MHLYGCVRIFLVTSYLKNLKTSGLKAETKYSKEGFKSRSLIFMTHKL